MAEFERDLISGLGEIGLSLRTDGRIVESDFDADGRHFVVATGANRGNKTTFLRSLGLAFLMMQAGLMVLATVFSAASPTRSSVKSARRRTLTSA